MKWYVLFRLYGLLRLLPLNTSVGFVMEGGGSKTSDVLPFIFKEINCGKIAIMTSLAFSNESVKLVLSLSAIST